MDYELIGYETVLRQMLGETREFRQFKLRATEALRNLGFSDWAYVRSDVPLDLGVEGLVGTSTQEQLDRYKSEGFADHDVMLQHVSTSNQYIFKSQVDTFMASSPVTVELIERNKDLSRLYIEYGYSDYCAIPVHYGDKNNHAIFTLAARKTDSIAFKDNVDRNFKKLIIFITVIDDIGTKKYPSHFLGNKESHEKIINGKPLKLLTLMAINDCNLVDAAKTLDISRPSADKYIAQIRNYLGVSTTHGALLEALKRGLISQN